MALIPRLELHELKAKADETRRQVVDVCVRNGAGHIAPSLSCVDVLTSLYYRTLRLDTDPRWEGRDRVIFSKGHGAYGLYAILADLGYVPRHEWENFYKGSPLAGCVEQDLDKGLEAGTGSLGHGLPMAVGLAFGAKLKGADWRTYCVVGDGEMQEGSCWEAIEFAVRHELGNLTVIVDKNNLQAMGRLDEVLQPRGRPTALADKLAAFGMDVATVPGHDHTALDATFAGWASRRAGSAPQVMLAETVKGYGVVAIENKVHFHFRLPTQDEINEGVRYGG